MNELWFNGKSSRDAGVKHIEHYPDLNRPERKIEVVEIPGRSGDIIFQYDAWHNIEREYDIFAGDGERGTAPGKFISISEWLNTPRGYARLEDTYEPDIFRLAYCTGGYDADNAFTRYGRATITFNCRPERFLKSGERELEVANGDILLNPTAYNAKPLLKVSCTSSADLGTIYIETANDNEYEIEFLQKPTTETYIDCDIMDTYFPVSSSRNNTVSIPDYPRLEPGQNQFIIPPGYTVKVIPRWFVI